MASEPLSNADEQETTERLATLFKALADPTRLRILGALANRPMTGKELAEHLELSLPTISHHLSKLTATRLIQTTRHAQSHAYALNTATLHQLSRQAIPSSETAAAPAGDMPELADDDERFRQKVIRDFFDGSRLREIPARRKKRVVVLQHLAGWFNPHRAYPEKEVNAILRQAHEDVATLRRELVDYGYLHREAGIYQVAATPPPRGVQVAQEITGDERAWLRQLVAGATARALDG